jgi:PTH1 family peptidyl-tRNA hydrolase
MSDRTTHGNTHDKKISLIALLGNPGREYERTRHNAGRLLAERLRFSLRWQSRFKGLYAALDTSAIPAAQAEAAFAAPPRPAPAAPVTAKAHFLLPDTYMNRSGEAVREAASFFKIPCAETLVVHDELELPLGEAAFKEGGGLGGHNGLRSVRDCLGSADFRRLRIGIGRPDGRKSAGDDISAWVLSPFTAEEEALLEGVLDVCASALETALLSGPAQFAGLKLRAGAL